MAETNNIDKKISDLDEEIQTLITQRFKLCRQAAESAPHEHALAPEQEAAVLRKALVQNAGSTIADKYIIRVFSEILSASRAMQQPIQVAFLGPEGTYSHAAAAKYFGHSVTGDPVPTIEEVFREVETGSAQYGVVPVENSTEGGVNQTLDCFMHSPVRICGEVELPIHHYLLSGHAHGHLFQWLGSHLPHIERMPFVQHYLQTHKLMPIKRVYAHQQALGQCRQWLDTHLPNIRRIALNSNAEAAQRVLHEPGAVAIAGQMAAELYPVQVVAKNIEDNPNNTTRFAILGSHEVAPTGRDKTSLVLSAADTDKSGSLHHLLAPLAENNLSMTRIESRPTREGMWVYLFYIDVEGHAEDAAMRAALAEIEARSALYKHLGSYPRALG